MSRGRLLLIQGMMDVQASPHSAAPVDGEICNRISELNFRFEIPEGDEVISSWWSGEAQEDKAVRKKHEEAARRVLLISLIPMGMIRALSGRRGPQG